MTEQLRQSLSAVIDGEADAFELRRVLDELGRDAELRAAWERYHLIGSVIRGERTVRSRSAARELAQRVPMAVREAVPAPDAQNAIDLAGADDGAPRAARFARGGWLGGGLAAALVLGAAVLLQPFGGASRPEPAGLAEATGQPGMVGAGREGVRLAAAEVDVPRRDPSVAQVVSQADLRRARAYMLQHAQQQGFEQRGVISLVKMAAYEAP